MAEYSTTWLVWMLFLFAILLIPKLLAQWYKIHSSLCSSKKPLPLISTHYETVWKHCYISLPSCKQWVNVHVDSLIEVLLKKCYGLQRYLLIRVALLQWTSVEAFDRFGVGVHAAVCRSIGWYGRNTLYHELMNRYLTVLSTMAIICSRTFLIGKLSPKNGPSVPSSFKHLHLRGALIRETIVLWKSVTYLFCAYTHAFIGAVAVMQSWSFLGQQMWGRHACYRDTWQETLLKPFLWVYDKIFHEILGCR